MAGDWIKVEKSTPDKPEILKMSRMLGISRDSVFGKWVRLWCWFDSNSVDGTVDGTVDADVDTLVEHDGFASAAKSVGWLKVDESNERTSLPNFDVHNGDTAKQRALKSKRQKKWRDSAVSASTAASTGAPTREEKRREEKRIQEPLQSPTGDGATRNGKPKSNPIYTEAFTNFWLAGPKHKRKSKGLAWKAWLKAIQEVDESTLIAKHGEYALSGIGKTEFCHQPAIWLNQRCWEDDPAAWVRGDAEAKPKMTEEERRRNSVPTDEDLRNWRP